ncbi:GNAT family N-acetyltransferase [Methylobacterium sp. ID0610]|uniref:GNAT family N-acetyltransferase n=1 Tax=Methylobacterium carpenticola TaxID=3344827 RepID=UPI0036A0224A
MRHTPMRHTPLRDNTEQSRFELVVDGEVVYADYARRRGELAIRYVYAPPRLRGTGAAGRLMAEIAALARAETLRIVPLCSYAGAWLRRHGEHRDLLA